MILSVHIADVGARASASALMSPPRAGHVEGLRYAATTLTAPLSGRLAPKPSLSRVGLIAAWDGDDDLDRFIADDPRAETIAGGFHARMRAVHVYGSFAPLAGLLGDEPPIGDEEPAAVLTIGRLRLSQTVRFLRASAAAEELATRSPGLLAASGLVRPPALVATFSLWRDRGAMRDYAAGRQEPAHADAVRAHAKRPFHHESAFIRLRPYRIEGHWAGVEPLLERAVT